jgi:UDP-GlcNAc:undecaprenyl-phosphate GlcNAc-1-phosphate transferase
VLLTVLVVVEAVNAINFVDGLDGLAAGIVGIGALAFFAYSYLLSFEYGFTRATLAALVSAILAGMCAGFLPHNINPARIFMGDTGSMLIGLLLASSVITLVGQLDPNVVPGPTFVPALLPILLPAAVMAVPLLDMLLAVVRRTRAGRSPFSPDKQHLHHRLLELGGRLVRRRGAGAVRRRPLAADAGRARPLRRISHRCGLGTEPPSL